VNARANKLSCGHGFFIATFAAFFAFDVSFLSFIGDAFFIFVDTFFGVLDLVFDGCLFSFGANERLRPLAGALVTASSSGLAAASLNDPEASLPLVYTSSPDPTVVFRYFLMNGDSFSESTM
jgi:hypothetical protein